MRRAAGSGGKAVVCHSALAFLRPGLAASHCLLDAGRHFSAAASQLRPRLPLAGPPIRRPPPRQPAQGDRGPPCRQAGAAGLWPGGGDPLGEMPADTQESQQAPESEIVIQLSRLLAAVATGQMPCRPPPSPQRTCVAALPPPPRTAAGPACVAVSACRRCRLTVRPWSAPPSTWPTATGMHSSTILWRWASCPAAATGVRRRRRRPAQMHALECSAAL